MTDIGKIIIALGLVLVVIGTVIWALGHLGFRGLPGDIAYQSPHVRFYFPIVSCLILSLILTGLMWLWRWFMR